MNEEGIYTEEDYAEDLEDEEDEAAERQRDMYGDESRDTVNIYKLFDKVMSAKDTKKVAFLSKETLGTLPIDVRNCFYIAMLAESLGHHGFAKFFLRYAEIQNATSLSREGFLTTLFVSQKKETTRKKSLGRPENLLNQPKKKKGLFRR